MGIRWLRLDIEEDRDDDLDDFDNDHIADDHGDGLDDMDDVNSAKEKEVNDCKKIKSQSLLSRCTWAVMQFTPVNFII